MVRDGGRSADTTALAPLSDLLTAPPLPTVTWLTVVKAALAATVAWLLADSLSGNASAVFAPILAMLSVQASLYGTVAQGFQTIVGNVIGVGLAQLLVNVAGTTVLSLFVGTALAIAAAQRLPIGGMGRAQVPFTMLLVILLGPESQGYGAWRLVDAAIGGLVGIGVALALPERAHLSPVDDAFGAWRAAVSAALDDVAADLRRAPADLGPQERHPSLLAAADSLRARDAAASAAMTVADESVRFNPRARRDRERLARLGQEMLWLRRVSLQARAIALGVDALYDRPGPPPRLDRVALADLLASSARLLEPTTSDDTLAEACGAVRAGVAEAIHGLTLHDAPVLPMLDSITLLGRVEQLRQEVVGDPERGPAPS